MLLATVILLIASAYVAFNLILLTKNRESLKFLGLAVATTLLFLIQIFVLIELSISQSSLANVASIIIEWGHVISLAFVLSSLAVFIRDSKPVFAQFPMIYTALPLLIVISYILVKDTYALKNWLLAIYQGGALTVGLLMYGIYTYRRNEFGLLLGGVVTLLISYLFYWYIPGLEQNYGWAWKILVSAGIILSLKGFEKVENLIPVQKINENI